MTDEPTALRAARLTKAIARGLHVRSERESPAFPNARTRPGRRPMTVES